MGIFVTMNPKQGVEMFYIINPRIAIPVHYNDYDVFISSLEDFKAEIKKAGLDNRVHYLTPGDTYFKI
ncbi:MAG TPA: hypothetical protein VD815_04610 [Candidatus Saccharimonadales bacterium]|nr:hypothetical protein [Candidatus Saccharimonadales bacterium]